VCCSVLQCAVVYCILLQCGARWCSVVQRVSYEGEMEGVEARALAHRNKAVLLLRHDVAVCCSVLLCAAAS